MDWNSLSEQEKRRLQYLLSLDSATIKALMQLDPKTIARLRKVADEDEKMEWLWASLRRIASTVMIVVGALVLFWEQVKNLVRSMLP